MNIASWSNVEIPQTVRRGRRPASTRTKPYTVRCKPAVRTVETVVARWTTELPASQVAPETPSNERRIRDCLAAGWGTLSKPLFYGLMRTGLSYRDAVAACTEALKFGLIVQRKGGGVCSWADKANRA